MLHQSLRRVEVAHKLVATLQFLQAFWRGNPALAQTFVESVQECEKTFVEVLSGV